MSRITVLLACLALGAAAHTAAQNAPAGFTVTPVFDTATVSAIRLQLAPGAREQPHAHDDAMLVVYLTPGEIEMQNGAAHTRGVRQPGAVDYFAPGATHWAANVGGAPVSGFVVTLKRGRQRAAAVPPSQPLAGVTRTPLLDNEEVAATRVELATAAREPAHTHPFDLIVVPITEGRLELQVAGVTQAKVFEPGEAVFVPRDTVHALANLHAGSATVVAVAIK